MVKVLCVCVWMKHRSSLTSQLSLQPWSWQEVCGASDDRLEETHHICEPGQSRPELRSTLLAGSLCLTHACAFSRNPHPPHKELSAPGAARRIGSAPSPLTCWLGSVEDTQLVYKKEDFCLAIFSSSQPG